MDTNISIIITTTDKDCILRETLPEILSQKYDGEYEVIVVRETRQGEVKDILKPLQNQFPHLRTTFLPDKPQYVTDSDIEVLLAVKASRYEHIVMIPPSMMPSSELWLQETVEKITSEDSKPRLSETVPLLLGNAHYHKTFGILKRYRHKKKVRKVMKPWCREKDLNTKALFMRGTLSHSITMAFLRKEYIADIDLREIIHQHIDI